MMDKILKYFSDLTEVQLKQLEGLEALYREWNAQINVISRKDIDSLYTRHVLHSLSIAAVFDFQPGSSIIDIGTGGGFPGIPLAIFFPETEFLLVDSIAKKLKVVDAISKASGISNITVLHSRAEDIKGRKFDFAVSRAVAPLKELWKWSRPLINKTGKKATGPDGQPLAPGLICLKGGDLAMEISESGTRPRVIEISQIFEEPEFEEKYLLFLST